MQKDNTGFSDEELMNLYQAGDFKAFELLYGRHSGRVFEYLRKKTSAEQAQELLQETFEKLHKSRDKYNSQYPFLPWLFTISRNTLNDFFKLKESRLAQASDSSPKILDNLILPTTDTDPATDLTGLLAGLPHPQRRAIELRYLNDWSFERIALEMNTSQTNIRQIISRGLKKVRSSLSKQGGNHES